MFPVRPAFFDRLLEVIESLGNVCLPGLLLSILAMSAGAKAIETGEMVITPGVCWRKLKRLGKVGKRTFKILRSHSGVTTFNVSVYIFGVEFQCLGIVGDGFLSPPVFAAVEVKVV